MRKFQGKVAVVTGAAGGIGLALAKELAREGMDLALLDWDAERLAEAETVMADFSVACSTHKVDVSDGASVDAVKEAVLESHGRVDLLVNVAGINLQKSFAGHSREDWDQVLGINLGGPVHMIQAFLPELRRRQDTHILNVSSMAGFFGLPTQSSYSASKAALSALGESLRIELGSEGIGVTTVMPGTIHTDLINRHLSRSENVEITQKIVGGMALIGMKPDKAARKMVKAVRGNRARVRIGIDSVLTDWSLRAFPGLLRWPLGLAYRKLLAR